MTRKLIEHNIPLADILEYINRAQDVRDRSDVALSTQTFSFFQELTEAVSTLPYAMMVVTLPASKIADVNRGIFLPLSNLADGGLTFTLELDVTSGEGIPPRVLEQTIKETVRQIGARVVEEQKG